MADSSAPDRIHRDALGLPPEVESSSLLPWAGVAEICTALGPTPDQRLVDLACGRGGYGLEVARRTGARLTGECLRILTGGGRLAVTCWEAVDPADDRLPDRLRWIHLARDLTEAGFADVEVLDRTAWRATERDLWEAALRTDADGDPAVESMRNEAARSLGWFDGVRRVLATATAPR